MGSLRSNPCFQALMDVCDEYDLLFSVEQGGKHPRLVFEIQGREHRFSFPGSPSDRRSPANTAAQFRKLLDRLTKPQTEAGASLATEPAPALSRNLEGNETMSGNTKAGTESKAVLVYKGTPIHDRNEMVCLTDMWRAEGSDPSRKPAEWLRSESAGRFIAFLAESLGMGEVGESHFGLVNVARGGSDRGTTFAHWQIGLAYAKYLSPEFHMWCNTTVRQHMEEMRGAAATLPSLSAPVAKDMQKITVAPVLRRVREHVDGLTQIVSAIGDASLQRDREAYAYAIKIRQDIADLRAITESMVTAERRLSAPAVASKGAFKDIDDIYDLVGVGRDGEKIPRRAFLTAAVKKSLDSYCRRGSRFAMDQIVVGGRAHDLWHEDGVLNWLTDGGGHRMIVEHLQRHAPKPAPMLTLIQSSGGGANGDRS